MKTILLGDKRLYDFGPIEEAALWADIPPTEDWPTLVIVPADLAAIPAPQHTALYGGEFRSCGGWRLITTKKGRAAITVQPGDSHILYTYEGCGSRSWQFWEDRLLTGPTVFSIAASTSRGGGCWTELSIFPASFEGVLTADQAEYTEDLS